MRFGDIAAAGDRRRLGERGSMAVEAALVFPLLIVLAFGIAEFALLMRDHVATTSLVRAGARTASSLPRADAFLQATADAVARSGSALPKGSFEELWIYEANAAGFPGDSSNRDFGATDCGQDCVRFTWDTRAGRFVPVSGTWAPSRINACLDDPQASSVGVYVKAKHTWITGLFFDTTSVADRAVMNFEPISGYTSDKPCK